MTKNDEKRWANVQESKIMKERIQKEMRARWDKSSLSELKERAKVIKEERRKIAASLKGSLFLDSDEEGGVYSIKINLSGGLKSIKFGNAENSVFLSSAEHDEGDMKLFLKIVDGDVVEKGKNDVRK